MKISYLEFEGKSLDECLYDINGTIDAKDIINIETSERVIETFGYDDYESGTECYTTVRVFYREE